MNKYKLRQSKLFGAYLVIRERTENIQLETTYCKNCKFNNYENIGRIKCIKCNKNK